MKSRYLTEDELERLRASMPDDHWRAVAVTLETGMRVGDVVALRRENLDGRRLSFTASKTGKPGECIISEALADELRAHAGPEWLFPSPRKAGKHIWRETVWKRLKRASRASGVAPAGCSPHSMRKVYAVELTAREGIRAVQEALQHDRISTTEEYALSDWATGDNAKLPLRRGDLPLLVAKIIEILHV